MLYVKIIGSNGQIISAEEHAEPVFVCYQNRNGIIVRCSAGQAQGILSIDGTQIYFLRGHKQMPGDYLVAEEISQADYEQLLTELEIPDEPEPDSEPEPGPDLEPVMSIEVMRRKIIELEENNAEKDERIEFLEDCLLEMSEVVYGETSD